MEDKKIVSAPVSSRFFAFLIDVFFVYLLRFFYINLSLQLWLKKPMVEFIKNYEMLYGRFDFKKITPIEIYYFLNSTLFKQLLIFVGGIFFVAVIYNLIFLSTKWSATIGQKLLGLRVVSKNGQKMKICQIISRSFAVVFPWLFIFIILFCKSLSDFGIKDILDKTSFVVSVIIFFSWYDFIFLTSNKLVFHDLLTGTRVTVVNIEKYENSSNGIWKILFPDFRDMYSGLKEFTKNQIEKAKKIKEEYKEKKSKK